MLTVSSAAPCSKNAEAFAEAGTKEDPALLLLEEARASIKCGSAPGQA